MQTVANVVLLASLYLLLATGFVLIYRGSRVMNLAYGDTMALGAYAILLVAMTMPVNWTLSVMLALVIGMLIGAAMYWLFVRPVQDHPVYVPILVTIALGILIRTGISLVFTSQNRYLDEVLQIPKYSVSLVHLQINFIDAALVGTALAYLLLVALGLRRTSFGIRMEAVAENADLAALRGISPAGVLAPVWGIAMIGAVLAGFFIGVRTTVSPDIWLIGLKGLTPALVGGLSSFRGLVPGCLLVAATEVLTIQYIDPVLGEVAPFLVMLAVLWVRPWGLSGKPEQIARG